MNTQKKSDARETFLARRNSVIVLLSEIISQLNDEKCPSLSDIDDCTQELKKLYQSFLLVQQNVLSPLLKCLDDFLAVKSLQQVRDEGMEDLKSKAKALRERLLVTKISEIKSFGTSLETYIHIIDVLKIQASKQHTYQEIEQEDQLLQLLSSTLGIDTLLKIAGRRFSLECTANANSTFPQANKDVVSLPEEVTPGSTLDDHVPSPVACTGPVAEERGVSEEKEAEPAHGVLQTSLLAEEAESRERDMAAPQPAEAVAPSNGANVVSEGIIPNPETDHDSSMEDKALDEVEGDLFYQQLQKTMVWQHVCLLAKHRSPDLLIWRTAIAYMSHFVVFEKKQVSDFIAKILAKYYKKEKLSKVVSEIFEKFVEWGILGFFKATGELKEKIMPSRVYCFTEAAEKEVKSITKILTNQPCPIVILKPDPSGAEGMKKIGLYKLANKYTNGKVEDNTEVIFGWIHTPCLARVLNTYHEFFDEAELSWEQGIAWTGSGYALYLKVKQQPARWYAFLPMGMFNSETFKLSPSDMPLLIVSEAQNEFPKEDVVKRLPANYIAGNMLFVLKKDQCFVRRLEEWCPFDRTFDMLPKTSQQPEQSKVDHDISAAQDATAVLPPEPCSQPDVDTAASNGHDPAASLQGDRAEDEIQFMAREESETQENELKKPAGDDGSALPENQVQTLEQDNSREPESISEERLSASQNTELPPKTDTEEILYIPSVPFLEDNLDIDPKINVKEYANSMLLDEILDPQKDHERFFTLIYKILKERRQTEYKDGIVSSSLGDAFLVCKALSTTEKHSGPYTDALIKFAYALNSDIYAPRIYSGYTLPSVIDTEFGCARVIKQAVLLNALFAPAQERDFALVTYAKAFLSDRNASEEPEEIRDLFLALLSIHGNNPCKGYTSAILAHFSKHDTQEEILSLLSREAQNLLGATPSSLRKIPMSYSLELFGKDNDISLALQGVKNKDVKERELVEMVLKDYDYDDKSNMSNILNDKIQTAWKNTHNGKKGHGGWVVEQSKRPLEARLDLLKKWYDATGTATPEQIKFLSDKRADILMKIDKVIAVLDYLPVPQRLILQHTLQTMKWQLSGENNHFNNHFATALHSGYFILDNQYIPVMYDAVPFTNFEPWRNALKHLVFPTNKLSEIVEIIFDKDRNPQDELSFFDNLNAKNLITAIMRHDLPEKISESDVMQAEDSIKTSIEEYQGKIELAYSYGQITEIEKENMIADIDRMQTYVSDSCEYGYMRRFLATLQERIAVSARKRRDEFVARVEKALSEVPPSHIKKNDILEKARKLITETGNYEVAEEYLNRCEASPHIDLVYSDDEPSRTKYLDEFLSDNLYTRIYESCAESDSSSIVAKRVQQYWPAGSANRENSEKLVNNWHNGVSSRADFGRTDRLRDFFNLLGFKVEKLESSHNPNISEQHRLYKIVLQKLPKNLDRYPTPFAPFGTMTIPGMDILVIRSKMTPGQLTKQIIDCHLTDPCFILFDKTLNLLQRRQIAEELHRNQFFKTCIIIDKVLLVYLSMKTNDRLQALLSCSLPFTYIQPFVALTGSVTDEMFRGRTEYLDKITNGTTESSMLLYGGRQLGKTAILQRAANMVHKPASREYALYMSIDVIRSEEKLAELLCHELGLRGISVTAKNLTEFARQLQGLFEGVSEKPISRLLLLLDEADSFLEECASKNYSALAPLVHLSRQTENRFKFVLAGLHNVFRATTARANNSPLGQLKALCVRPFSPLEAKQLLQIPMEFLGYSFQNEEKLELVLSKSNYYPGILHFFGNQLLETMAKQYSTHFSAQKGHPPCVLTEQQLQATIASQDMNVAINDKLSLTLDLDHRYRFLALCIAMNYYMYPEQRSLGSTVHEIMDIARLLDIAKITVLTSEECLNLLLEMTEMAILQNVSKENFRLRKRSFLSLFGNNDTEVEQKIEKCLKNLK